MQNQRKNKVILKVIDFMWNETFTLKRLKNRCNTPSKIEFKITIHCLQQSINGKMR